MNEYDLYRIDLVEVFCKNFQRLNTIEIRYTTYLSDDFAIEYKFHEIDFEIWLELVKLHRERVDNCELLDQFDNSVPKPIKARYNAYKLVSKDFSLYRNINLIPFLKKKDGTWDNMREQIELNTWEIEDDHIA